MLRLVLLGGALLTALAGTSAVASAAPGTAYVTDLTGESVTPIDLATNKAGMEITKVGKEPAGIAITPDGMTAYVTNEDGESVTPIERGDEQTRHGNQSGQTPGCDRDHPGRPDRLCHQRRQRIGDADRTGDEQTRHGNQSGQRAGRDRDHAGRKDRLRHRPHRRIGDADRTGDEQTRHGNQSGHEPAGIAITPDGRTAYVTNSQSESVTPIELATNKAGTEIKVGERPFGIAITPDGRTTYVADFENDSVTPIELATNKAGTEIGGGMGAFEIAITLPAPPTVVTEAASALTQTSATLNALVNPNGGLVGECKLEYGTSASYGSAVTCTPSPGFGPSPVAVSAPITGLAANTEYHVGSQRPTRAARAWAQTGPSRPSRSRRRARRRRRAQRLSAPPAITAARLTNRRFRVGRQATAISARKTPIGTSVHFTLSAAARLQIAITRSAPGLRHGHSCLAPSAKLKRAHAKRCTRTLTLGTLIRASEPEGADSFAFSGRIGHRALSPGAYHAVLSASNAGGRSKPVTLSFTVVR